MTGVINIGKHVDETKAITNEIVDHARNLMNFKGEKETPTGIIPLCQGMYLAKLNCTLRERGEPEIKDETLTAIYKFFPELRILNSVGYEIYTLGLQKVYKHFEKEGWAPVKKDFHSSLLDVLDEVSKEGWDITLPSEEARRFLPPEEARKYTGVGDFIDNDYKPRLLKKIIEMGHINNIRSVEV